LIGRAPLGALALLVALAPAAAPANTPPPRFAQAVEFPYYLSPRNLWEQELVWIKSIGVDTIEFSIPWNWHQNEAGAFDFTGATSPRRDLQGFVRLLRRLNLHAWVKGAPPVPGWLGEGWPENARNNPRALAAWQKAVADLLTPQTASHGGPVIYAEGLPELNLDAPPQPVVAISAADPDALFKSRAALDSVHGTLLWTDFEDGLYPAGWAGSGPFLRRGAIPLGAVDRSGAFPVRRSAMLLRSWAPLFSDLEPAAMPKPETKLPDGVTTAELVSGAGVAVRITNRSMVEFHDDLRVGEPSSKRILAVPGVDVPARQSLWLPVFVPFGPDGLCRGCTRFASSEKLIYATAELLSIEFENGILAMEFCAPVKAEAVLQLAREPVGPYLAAGKPTKFDWDDKALRARLPIPAGSAPDYRVRVGLAIEETDTAAFFNDAHRLIIGARNTLSTAYSSPEVAARSRLLAPDGFASKAVPKSPNEVDYEVSTPAEAVHGDTADLALETDGLALGRARVQMMRPLTVRLLDALSLHFGQRAELATAPAIVSIDPKGGATLELSLRNNWPEIRTYKLQFSSPTLDVFPPSSEITIGPLDERRLTLRAFSKDSAAGLQAWTLKVSGAADFEIPFACVLVPRNQTAVWSADLDGDGSPEWVLESSKVRAVFSSRDGGRWMEFTWKDGGVNFAPEQGSMRGSGNVEIEPSTSGLTMSGHGWTRRIELHDASLVFEQTGGTMPEGLEGRKQGNRTLAVRREASGRVFYSLE